MFHFFSTICQTHSKGNKKLGRRASLYQLAQIPQPDCWLRSTYWERVTPFLVMIKHIHRLTVSIWAQFKVLAMTFRSLNGLGSIWTFMGLKTLKTGMWGCGGLQAQGPPSKRGCFGPFSDGILVASEDPLVQAGLWQTSSYVINCGAFPATVGHAPLYIPMLVCNWPIGDTLRCFWSS